MRAATGLAEHLNMMHQVRRGHRSIALRNIDEQANGELQREPIDTYGGLDRWWTCDEPIVAGRRWTAWCWPRAKPLATLTSSRARS